jgi:hypothetical protein
MLTHPLLSSFFIPGVELVDSPCAPCVWICGCQRQKHHVHSVLLLLQLLVCFPDFRQFNQRSCDASILFFGRRQSNVVSGKNQTKKPLAVSASWNGLLVWPLSTPNAFHDNFSRALFAFSMCLLCISLSVIFFLPRITLTCFHILSHAILQI